MLGAKESFQDDGAEGKNKGESYEQDGLRAGELLGERCSFEVLLELFEVHDYFLSLGLAIPGRQSNSTRRSETCAPTDPPRWWERFG